MDVEAPQDQAAATDSPAPDPKQAARFARELELVRQPVFDLRTGELFHHELLLRVRGPRGTLESPGRYLDAAKREGISAVLDAWVAERAAQLIHPDDGSGRPQLEVNLSAETALSAGFSDHLTALLDLRGASASALIVEVDDNRVDTAGMAHFSRRLFKLGHHFTLEEFERSGLNVLGRLRSLPFDYIKIDGAFIRELGTSKADHAIVGRIAQMVSNVGRKSVAMHVQDEETVSIVRELGVDLAQGFFLGLPERLPAE